MSSSNATFVSAVEQAKISLYFSVPVVGADLLTGRRQASVEGDVESVQRGLPAHGPAGPALAGGTEGHDRHVDALQGGLFVGEVAAGFDRPADSGVYRLDPVRRADDATGLGVAPQEGRAFPSGVFPQLHERRILPSSDLGKPGEPLQGASVATL